MSLTGSFITEEAIWEYLCSENVVEPPIDDDMSVCQLKNFCCCLIINNNLYYEYNL